jgi:hypothetical protein
MKKILITLGLTWVVMALVGCARDGGSSRTLHGDRTGNVSIEHSNGVVQNLQNGNIGVRRGAWVQDLTTGKMHYTYGNVIEEPRK